MLIMSDYVDQVNMNEEMVSANAFSVKEEQSEEDSFIEDKVYVSETAVSIDNELHGPIWYGKIKQYEDTACFDNIKTELASVEVTEVQNDNVKIQRVIKTDNIKIEFDSGLPYCEHCQAFYEDYCIKCRMLVHILNKHSSNNADGGAQEDIPNNILEIRNRFGQIGVYALRIIPAGVKFGPFIGLCTTECPWEIKGETFALDKNKWKSLNWMQYVNPTRNTSVQNLCAFQCEDNIYYRSTRQIHAGDELLVYFGDGYGSSHIKIARRVDFVTTTKDIGKDIFACTFCCLGFSSKSHLAKHKAICVEDAARSFSIEELTQCPFCKIHLDPKEYFEHHAAFCCERNARKDILPTNAAAAMNRPRKCLRPIYKCEQCKYRTKYQVDLKEHNKQHYDVKMYKCGICNRHFKTQESLRLHLENTHAFVRGKDNQEHSTSGYRNALIKVGQSSSHDQKKIFKCSLCVFQAKYKQSLRKHRKAKHLKKFDYKCDSCQFGTNSKSYLEYHIKTNHLKQFNYKCDSCEYKTNYKSNLEVHIKTKHLKEFDYECDSCQFRTNKKCNLQYHVKSKHLKKYDFKCDSCEYGTNYRQYLEGHIKTVHLKKIDYQCDECEFGTNFKTLLKRHIKTSHLKEFNFKCDFCDYGTNHKQHLKQHLKTKHLKEFDYKCHYCEFGTNNKHHLEQHLKTKHLKEFNFKCDSCEFGTNYEQHLEGHIKAKHVKEFDYKCDKCEFGTHIKTILKKHIKTNHLNEFNFKCDSCEFGTNHKQHLDQHLKTKHLKKFDFKCEYCEFGTNGKHHLEIHIKTKHLKQFDYKCVSCKYKTNQKSDLKRHMKRKHS